MAFEKRVETYFHLSAWAPGTIRVEGVYPTPIEASRYWTAQHDAQQQLDTMLPEMVKLHEALALLGLSPEAAARAKGQAQAAKEDLYETVRAAEFRDAPSRRRCMFVCESEEQLREYIARYKFPTAGRTVFELQMVTWTVKPTETQLADMQLSQASFQCLNELRRVRVNPRFLDSNGENTAKRTMLAQRYWSSDNTEPEQLTEVLFEGLFVVKRIVETWPAAVQGAGTPEPPDPP